MELLLWYEAIFGKEMWKHVVVETSFWSHSEEAVQQRWNERGQVRVHCGDEGQKLNIFVCRI